MRIPILLSLSALFFTMCNTNSLITGSWKGSATTKYDKIVVMGLTMQTNPKAMAEIAISDELSKTGVIAFNSVDVFPSNVANEDCDHKDIMDTVSNLHA